MHEERAVQREDRRDYHLRVPLSPAERRLVEHAVRQAGDKISAWARRHLINIAKLALRRKSG